MEKISLEILMMVKSMKVLITGATSGIGRKVAEVLVERGHFVYLTVHRPIELQKVQREIKSKNMKCLLLDITKEEERRRLLSLDIDCLINHAGIGYGGSLLTMPFSHLRDNFEVNFFASFALIQLLLPQLLEKEKGKIIIVSSLAGILPIPFLGSYCSSKAAISMFAKCFRQELKFTKSKLQVCLIEPGIYNTGFNDYMLENKEETYFTKPYFSEPELLQSRMKQLFRLFGKNHYHSIVKQYVKAVEAKKMRKVYRAPFLSRIGMKLYLLFMG